MYQVCNHLVEPIPRSMFEGEESRNSYTLPGRYHQSIFKRDVLWEYFRVLENLKKKVVKNPPRLRHRCLQPETETPLQTPAPAAVETPPPPPPQETVTPPAAAV